MNDGPVPRGHGLLGRSTAGDGLRETVRFVLSILKPCLFKSRNSRCNPNATFGLRSSGRGCWACWRVCRNASGPRSARRCARWSNMRSTAAGEIAFGVLARDGGSSVTAAVRIRAATADRACAGRTGPEAPAGIGHGLAARSRIAGQSCRVSGRASGGCRGPARAGLARRRCAAGRKRAARMAHRVGDGFGPVCLGDGPAADSLC